MLYTVYTHLPYDQRDPAVKPASLLVYVDRNNNRELNGVIMFHSRAMSDAIIILLTTAQQKESDGVEMRN